MTPVRPCLPLALLILLLLGLGAEPRPAVAADDEVGAVEALFFKAYYLQHAERRTDEALLLYLHYLAADREGAYARRAARFAHGLLTSSGSDNLDAFLRLYGDLLEEQDAPVPDPVPVPDPDPDPAPSPAATPRNVDVVLLDRYLEQAKQGVRPPEVVTAETNLRQRDPLWRRGDFMEGLRRVTSAYRVMAIWRVAEMLQRKRQEVEALQKQVSIQEGFGADAEADALKAEIQATERAIELARDEHGLYQQIWKLHLPSNSAPVADGFLPLVRGIHRPDDPAFAGWVPKARSWLKQQSMRRGSSDEAIQDAVRVSQVLQAIENHQRTADDEAARVAARGLWRSLTRGR